MVRLVILSILVAAVAAVNAVDVVPTMSRDERMLRGTETTAIEHHDSHRRLGWSFWSYIMSKYWLFFVIGLLKRMCVLFSMILTYIPCNS